MIKASNNSIKNYMKREREGEGERERGRRNSFWKKQNQIYVRKSAC
jgi:hypothetical protein